MSTFKPALKDFPDEVLHGTFFERNVPVDKMFVDFRYRPGGYARPLNSKRLSKLIAEFDRQAMGILLLSLRNDGTFAIIDGQHRREAAMAKGITGLDAYVYIDLTVEDEARLYRKFGDYLKQTARDKFLASLVERQPEAVAINRLLEEQGLHVAQSTNNTNGVAAVEALINVTRQQGPHILRETLKLLHDSFGGEPRAYIGSAIKGAAMFLDRHLLSQNFKRARLVERLKRGGFNGWQQKALNVNSLERGDLGTAYGKALMLIHDWKPGGYKLTEWPERKYSKEVTEQFTARLRTMQPMVTRLQQERAAIRTLEVNCLTCGAQPGTPCIGTQYYHKSRRAKASRERIKAQRAG